jgi:hypothetical protein
MFRGSAGRDDTDYIITKDKDNDKNPAQVIHTKCDMPDFVIDIDVFLPKQVVIFEYAYCIGKINPMFPEIAFSLSAMPFVCHDT